MRIAGAILAIFPISIIILVQSLAAGTADALDKSGGSGGTFGFFVAIGFIVGAGLLFGKVMRGALGMFAATGILACIGAASSIFSDLWVWGAVAIIYAVCILFGLRRARVPADVRVATTESPGATPAPIAAHAAPAVVRFDPHTGAPLQRERRFDPYTGKPIVDEGLRG